MTFKFILIGLHVFITFIVVLIVKLNRTSFVWVTIIVKGCSYFL